jgi:hypothetical protein
MLEIRFHNQATPASANEPAMMLANRLNKHSFLKDKRASFLFFFVLGVVSS